MTITSDRLRQRLDYIEFRRAGGSLQPLIDEDKEEKKAELTDTVNDLSKKLKDKEEGSNKTLVGLVKELEDADYLAPAQKQLDNLKTTLADLKERQVELKANNTKTEQEMVKTKGEREELHRMVGNLRQQLLSKQNQEFPHKDKMIQFGDNVSKAIGGVK